MKKTWLNILKSIKEISPSTYETVLPPATAQEIHSLEQGLGRELPRSVKEYLEALNGQSQADLPLLGYSYFLTTAGMLDAWSMMNDLFQDEDKVDWVEEDKIKPFLWSDGWIPFTDFEASTRLILDLTPGKNGSVGQVFLYYPGMDYTGVIANSFEDFSKNILQRFISGEFLFEDHVIQLDAPYEF